MFASHTTPFAGTILATEGVPTEAREYHSTVFFDLAHATTRGSPQRVLIGTGDEPAPARLCIVPPSSSCPPCSILRLECQEAPQEGQGMGAYYQKQSRKRVAYGRGQALAEQHNIIYNNMYNFEFRLRFPGRKKLARDEVHTSTNKINQDNGKRI